MRITQSNEFTVFYDELPEPVEFIRHWASQDYDIKLRPSYFRGKQVIIIDVSTDTIGASFIIYDGSLVRTFHSMDLLAHHALDTVEAFYKSISYSIRLMSTFKKPTVLPGNQSSWNKIAKALNLREL